MRSVRLLADFIGEGGKGMRKYGEQIGFLVVFIVLVNSIDWANQYMQDLISRTFGYMALGASVEILGLFIFGLFLGSLGFICELKKDGYWKMNKERLLVLGLPLLIVMVMGQSTYLGIMWPQMIQKLMFYILASSSIFKFIAIFSGYIIISLFTKESESIIGNQVNTENNQNNQCM